MAVDNGWQKHFASLFFPISVLPMVCFRVLFGVIMLWEVGRYFQNGWIDRYYIQPSFFFTYAGFDWVKPWDGNGMYLHFYILGLLAGCIALGLFYRLSMALFCVGFLYVFLLDQTNYLNHFYLIILMSFLMIFVPAHTRFSVDVLLRPQLRADFAPRWTYWILVAQLGIVYFYGGLAKLNTDWLHGQPMHLWLSENQDFPLIGRYFGDMWMAYLFSYGGLLFDLLIFPILLWRRTFLLGLLLAGGFHFTNAQLFNIGIFPYFMLASLVLFVPSAWWNKFGQQGTDRIYAVPTKTTTSHRITTGFLTLYFAFQLLFPLRHHLYDNNVSWSEEGHMFAWHMKLRDKEVLALQITVIDTYSETQWEVHLPDYLTERQIQQMSDRPAMLLQFAHHVAAMMEQENGFEVAGIYAIVVVSLNGHPPAYLIDPRANLAEAEQDFLKTASWIMPPPS